MDSVEPPVDGLSVGSDELPAGYQYRATHYADIILRDAFADHWDDLSRVLGDLHISFDPEILEKGGNRTRIAKRFDDALEARGWGTQNMDISTHVNQQLVSKVRSHEIDMFKLDQGRFPGVAIEMEWNNKDPFFDRDLSNFYALHRAGALAVGIIVTRAADLQRHLAGLKHNLNDDLSVLGFTPKQRETLNPFAYKYGASTTHWDKLMPRVDVGAGGECPLLLIGIKCARISELPNRFDPAPYARPPST